MLGGQVAMTHVISPIHARALGGAIDRALDYLGRGQLPSGQFRIERTVRATAESPPTVTPDDAPFATSHIVHSLSFASPGAVCDMIARAVDYLRREQVGPGVWRHWNKANPRHRFVPPDLDDTACISYVLERHGRGAPDNKRLLLVNRNRQGLFYTWIIPRPVLTGNMQYWWLVLRDLNLGRALLFWRRTPARRGDIDGVVNANVLLYLGERPETGAVVDYLLRVVREAREERCDMWYVDRYAFHYALSRAYAGGVARLGQVREAARARLVETAHADGRIGGHELHTALAVCALSTFGETSGLLDDAVAYLLRVQEADGGWASQPFYYGSPLALYSWGSRELTTAFCVEALERYQAGRATPHQVS